MFISAFTPIAVSTEAAALINLGGSGWVRDLQEAATQSPELIEIFNDVKDAATRAGYVAAVADLLRTWGNRSAYNNASKQALTDGYGLILSDPLNDQERGWMSKAIKAGNTEREAYRETLSESDRSMFDAMRERMVGGLEKVEAYEAFTGFSFLNWSQLKSDALDYHARTSISQGRIAVEVWVPLTQIILENRNAVLSSEAGYIRVTIPTPTSGESHAETLWNRLVDDATANLMPTLRLSKYVDMVDLSFSETGVKLDFTRLNAALAAARAANPIEGATLFLDLKKVHGSQFEKWGWTGSDQLLSLLHDTASDRSLKSAFVASGYGYMDPSSTTGTVAEDVFAGDGLANRFDAGAGDDLLEGGGGDDTLFGDTGNDRLYGGLGDDTLNAGDGADQVLGGLGADTINGGAGDDVIDGGDGADTITDTAGANNIKGGLGNDTITGRGTMEGGQGDDVIIASDVWSPDTYVFNLGDGKDTINDYGVSTAMGYGAGLDDTLKFGTGIAASEVTLGRNGNDLVFKVSETDQVSVKDWYVSNYKYIEKVEFADGTAWDSAKLKTMVPEAYSGTAAADSINGWDGIDNISALAGNDTLNGYGGNDILDGGEGDDTINAGDGADQVLGGLGADTINGGAGDDVIDGGDGADTITDTAGANNIKGGLGNDTITGRGTMEGGQGDDVIIASDVWSPDTYVFNLGDGKDTINDYGVSTAMGYGAGLDDTLKFGTGIAADQLWFKKVGNDLDVTRIGSTEGVVIKEWYSGSYQHIEQFKSADGKTLLDSQVNALVSAMADFAPPAAGQTTLPADYQTSLNPVIAANWK